MITNSEMTNALRVLSIDMIQKANSGHPGAPLGMAEMIMALWNKQLKHNPKNPKWFNRDRFVLSNGHASALLYSLLHLTGYELSIEDLKNFRQFKSKTPGHPEIEITPGVETTTGPLGQGLANAVGFALAEKLLALKFNKENFPIVDHFTFAFVGDGCLMEGISHEVCSLAGTWKLNKLIVLYDDNGISIDGKVKNWFSEDIPARFESYGFNVIKNVDGHSVEAVEFAIKQAKQSKNKPTLICCKTKIGKGSPNREGTAKAHGEPLGEEEIKLTKQNLNCDLQPFEIPEEIYKCWDFKEQGQKLESEWQNLFDNYSEKFPELSKEFKRRINGDFSENFDNSLKNLINQAEEKQENVASRKASQIVLEELTKNLPELLGGSADLTSSNLTKTSSLLDLNFQNKENKDAGRHISYGVREFGMAAIMNGLAIHGGFIPYGGTFLTFSDYSRNAIRMAALMKQRVIHVFTHDSIGLGEDGPTHQSIEHASSLRLIPNLDVWRPADVTETAVAWQIALNNKSKPTALLLSRQNLPHLNKSQNDLTNIKYGAYILSDVKGKVDNPQLILIATGSEVHLALKSQEELIKENIFIRVVSMPSTTTFDNQTEEYKAQILPNNLPKIVLEMGVSDFWFKYKVDEVIGINSYGESAPASVLFEHFGFTVNNVIKTVRKVLN